VNAVMNLRVPQNAGNFLPSWETVSFSRRHLLHRVIWSYILKGNTFETNTYITWEHLRLSERCRQKKNHLRRVTVDTFYPFTLPVQGGESVVMRRRSQNNRTGQTVWSSDCNQLFVNTLP
jgi:hypothetical protein